MKTETSTIDPIWTNNIDMLPQEECLPVIGSCQVSSILQTLDVQNMDGVGQNVDLIILPPHDVKLPVDSSVGLQGNYIILKDKNHKVSNKPKMILSDSDNKKKKDSFEDMLYFVCNLCPFLCTKDSKITEHVENAHKNKSVVTQLTQLKCPACPNIFYHKMSLRSHLIHDHGVGNSDLNQIIQTVIYYANKNKIKEKESKIPTTPQVKAPTIVKEPLENDIGSIEENEDSLTECNDFIDLDKFHLSQKMEQKQEMKVVVLPQVDLIQKDSDKIFNSLKKQKDPVKLIDIKKTNKCVVPSCNVKFQDVEKLKYHITCHVENGFECNDCNEKFMFWKTLASHLWRIHKIDMDLYSCDKCEYKTYSLAKLNNSHKLIHSEVRGFTCNICNKAFKNSKQVRNHKMTHKDKSVKLQYSCQVCTKNFTSKKPLKVHMDVVHKNIRPFLCSYCGYKGSSRSSLKMHVRQHTGEKPFSCCYCSYTTSDHNSLRRHKLRHTGQKPYKCSYCSYACIQSSTYKTHLKTKHPGMEKDLMFTCHECQFRSVNKDMFVTHMITAHKIKPS